MAIGACVEGFFDLMDASVTKLVDRVMGNNNIVYSSNGPTAREAAAMCEDVYNTANVAYKEGKTPDMGLNGWHLDKTMADQLGLKLTDPNSGFNSALYSRVVFNSQTNRTETQYCYVLAGTDPLSGTDWIEDGNQALGKSAPQYTQALENAKKIQKNGILSGHDFTVTGHSLGGGLASAISLKLNVHGITFNAAGLHNETKNDWGIHHDKRANIDAYVVESEIVHSVQGKFGLVAEGRMHVLPGGYLPRAPDSLPCADIPNKLIDRINFGIQLYNHTIGAVRKKL
jgi:hypothetical protein